MWDGGYVLCGLVGFVNDIMGCYIKCGKSYLSGGRNDMVWFVIDKVYFDNLLIRIYDWGE